ncbi:MAG: hypothetical protein M3162_04720 [Thermoproteota archaeon]|nr:hypothetical protein [Thermoproteota archaeon]
MGSPLLGAIDIINNSLLLVDWKTITGVLIASTEIASIIASYFDNIRKIAKE